MPNTGAQAGPSASGVAQNGQPASAGAQAEPDVYVAGFETNAAGKSVACYWKNGIQTVLTDAYHAEARAITVLGSDVYIAGHDNGKSTIGVYYSDAP